MILAVGLHSESTRIVYFTILNISYSFSFCLTTFKKYYLGSRITSGSEQRNMTGKGCGVRCEWCHVKKQQ